MPSPSTTTRLALVKPDPNPATGDFVDITTLNANADKMDAAAGAFPCTAATRPIAPNLWDGRLIRETDTRRVLVWNATQAVWDPVNGPFLCSSGTRPASPFTNMMIRETDTRRVYIWNATQNTWDRIATGFPATSSTGAQVSGFTNTAAAPGTSHGHAFVAPASGEVYVTITSFLEIITGTIIAHSSRDVRVGNVVGSGAVVDVNGQDKAVLTGKAVGSSVSASCRTRVTGLTPFADYNVQEMHWLSAAGSATIWARTLLVEPVL